LSAQARLAEPGELAVRLLDKCDPSSARRLAQLSEKDFEVLFDSIPARREQPFHREIEKALGSTRNSKFAHLVRRLCVVLAHVQAYATPGGRLKRKVLEILGFSTDRSYMDMFGDRPGSKTVLEVFDSDAEERGERYYLHPKAPALNLVERGLCQEYARGELKWADESEWPAWMR
jgi:hypothetical protein